MRKLQNASISKGQACKKQKRLDASEIRNEWRNGYVIYKAVIIKCGIQVFPM